MSGADPIHKQVSNFIQDYLKNELSVSGMQRLHEGYFSEPIDFRRWKEVRKEYTLKQWSKEEFQQFVQYAKQFVAQDHRTVSEVYLSSAIRGGFLDADPNQLSNENPYSPNKENESGFVSLSEDNEQNRGLYIHVQNQISVRYSGTVNRYKEESIIPFEYDPELDILIAESTYPPDVQRLKSAFNRNTQYGVEIFNSEGAWSQFGPAAVCQRLRDITFVTDVELTHIDVDFTSQSRIREFSPDYTPPQPPEILNESNLSTENFGERTRIQGAEARILINENQYEFKISSGSRMFYTQVRNPPRRQFAKQLLQQIRPEVVDIFTE